MENLYLNIADVRILIQTELPLRASENVVPFVVPPFQEPQERICIQSAEKLPLPDGPILWNQNIGESHSGGKRCVFRRLTEKSLPFTADLYESDWERVSYFLNTFRELPVTMENAVNGLLFEEVLLRHHALMLHSSFIRQNGRGILFSAPSGTGKSTQADLWAKYKGADILNGDRSGIRKKDGVWTAYGLPFAGTSGIYRQENAPVSALVLLEQGPKNVLEALTPAQALRKVLPEFTLHRWDENFLNQGLNLILDFLSAVPVYRLSCLPDRGAVELLYNEISQEETT